MYLFNSRERWGKKDRNATEEQREMESKKISLYYKERETEIVQLNGRAKYITTEQEINEEGKQMNGMRAQNEYM